MTATVSALRLHRIDVTDRTTWLIVEVLTDEGLLGVGECSDATHIEDVPAAVADAFEQLAGAELTTQLAAVEQRLWEWAVADADPGRRFMRGTVVGGIATALCDIAAQAGEVPLWRWLGGSPRPAVRCYANINRSAGERRPRDFARLAARAVDDGFTSVKLAPFDGPALANHSLAETGSRHVHAVREAVGDRIDIFVDVHHRLSRDELGWVLPSLEEARIGWLEDAVDVTSAGQLAWLAERTSIPLAGGEQIVDPAPLSSAVHSGHLSVLLLDPKYVGGPTRLAALLDQVRGVAVTYHNPTGPVATAACVHLSTMHPDFTLLEYAYGEEVDRAALVEPAEHLQGGEMAMPAEPGLGVRARLDAVSQGHTIYLSQRSRFSATNSSSRRYG